MYVICLPAGLQDPDSDSDSALQGLQENHATVQQFD